MRAVGDEDKLKIARVSDIVWAARWDHRSTRSTVSGISDQDALTVNPRKLEHVFTMITARIP